MKFRLPVCASYANYVPVFPAQERTHAQKAGLAYERKILKQLEALYKNVKPSPWLTYSSGTVSGICQPDALMWIEPNHICIVEIKLSWVANARDKLLNFYGPIVKAIHKDCKVSYLQIYKNTKAKAHKRKLSFHELNKIRAGTYKECQHLP